MERVGEVVSPAAPSCGWRSRWPSPSGRLAGSSSATPSIQLIDVLAGSLVDELAAAEHHAAPGEVVLGQSALDALGERVEIGERRTDAESGGAVGVARRAERPSARARAPPSRSSRCPRSSSGRGCCRPSTSACAPGAASSSPSCGRRSRLRPLRRHRLRRRRRRRRRSWTTSSVGRSGLRRLRRQRPAV